LHWGQGSQGWFGGAITGIDIVNNMHITNPLNISFILILFHQASAITSHIYIFVTTRSYIYKGKSGILINFGQFEEVISILNYVHDIDNNIGERMGIKSEGFQLR
jgi:hypothetical protein